MAFCPNCGNQVSESAPTCPQCGHPLSAGIRRGRRNADGAVASLVLGIVSFVVPIVGIVTAPLAIIFGSKAKKQVTADPGLEGAGIATAGRVLGWIGASMFIVVILIFVLVFAGSTTTSSTFSCTANSIDSMTASC